MTKASPARTWKGNDYQAVWWDEATRLDEVKQFQDHARKVIQKCADDISNAVDRMLTAWDHAEIRGKFWAGKLPDTVSNAELEAALSSKVTQLNILDGGYHGWNDAELRDLIEKIAAGESKH